MPTCGTAKAGGTKTGKKSAGKGAKAAKPQKKAASRRTKSTGKGRK